MWPPHDPRDSRQLLLDELREQSESGFEVTEAAEELQSAELSEGEVGAWFERLERAPRRDNWEFDEPSDLEQVFAAMPDRAPRFDPDKGRLGERIHGAWLGRLAGCMLGKPVEGWSRAEIREYLNLAHSYPLSDFIPFVEDPPAHLPSLKPSWTETTRGRVFHVARDDDVDYTILGLHLLESHGFDFTSEDVLAELIDHLPFTQVYTAERVTYRNVVDGLLPPATATHRNPYREWIGALIRADIFGMVAAGDPRAAANLAYRDARTSHTGNGLYGSLWAAALVAAALTAANADEALRISLLCVPRRTRMDLALNTTIGLFDAGASWEDAMEAIDRQFGAYSWVHVLPNVAAIAAALLWSGNDHLTAVGLAVAAGRDTDSTAATVGAVMGALHGPEGVAQALAAPLRDRVRSAIAGFDQASISELASRTIALRAED